MEDTLQFEGWKKFRKKPVVIEARLAIPGEVIKTLEGDLTAPENGLIIRGVEGEEYPIDGAIFLKTYEPASDEDEA